MRRRAVEVGQRYRSRDASWLVWEVKAIGVDSMNVPHAKIEALSITEERTVACSVLADPRRFQFVAEPRAETE